MKNIQLLSSELLEYKCYLERLAFDHQVFEKEENTGFISKPLRELIGKMDGHMTALIRSDLLYFSKTLLVHHMIQYCVMIMKLETVEAFIDHMEQLTPKEVKDLYLFGLIERTSDDDMNHVLKEISEDDYLNQMGINGIDIKEFLEVFEELLPRLLGFFQVTYDRLFKPYRLQIMGIVNEEKVFFEKWYESDPVQFIKVLFKINIDELIEGRYEADFYVSVTNPNKIGYMMEKDHPEMLYVCFGYLVAARFKQDNSEMLLKYLGESTKMTIVKLLAKEPMYASAIAQALDLNRATVGHHMNQLAHVGVVQVAYSKGNRAYYALNMGQIKEGLNQFIEGLCQRGADCHESKEGV